MRTAAGIVKRALSHSAWALRAPWITNPRLSRDAQTLLFVCKGNICRSPFAALLAARLVQEAGRADIRCTSAGLEPSSEGVPPAAAIAAARKYGVSLGSHAAVRMTDALIASHDAIIVMEPAQREEVNRRWPEARDRVFLLPLFGVPVARHYEHVHIADPYGKSVEVFDACYARIQESVRSLISGLGSPRSPGERDFALSVELPQARRNC